MDDPINSRLNYGCAVMRSHDNQLNAFNLADDMIEPWRPMVDLVAHKNIGTNVVLSKAKKECTPL